MLGTLLFSTAPGILIHVKRNNRKTPLRLAHLKCQVQPVCTNVRPQDRWWMGSVDEGVLVLCPVLVSRSGLVMDTGAFLHTITLLMFVCATAAHLEIRSKF